MKMLIVASLAFFSLTAFANPGGQFACLNQQGQCNMSGGDANGAAAMDCAASFRTVQDCRCANTAISQLAVRETFYRTELHQKLDACNAVKKNDSRLEILMRLKYNREYQTADALYIKK
jgi:hypothetical protein